MIRRFATLPAAALVVALVTACASAQPVSPLPVDAQPSATIPSPEPSATRSAEPTPTRPASSDACLGTTRYEIGTQEELQPSSLCFGVGGVLRVTDAGPGEVHATPASRASSNYEAGVTDIRFIRSGSVTVTYPHGSGTWTIAVIVTR